MNEAISGDPTERTEPIPADDMVVSAGISLGVPKPSTGNASALYMLYISEIVLSSHCCTIGEAV